MLDNAYSQVCSVPACCLNGLLEASNTLGRVWSCVAKQRGGWDATTQMGASVALSGAFVYFGFRAIQSERQVHAKAIDANSLYYQSVIARISAITYGMVALTCGGLALATTLWMLNVPDKLEFAQCMTGVE